MTHRTLRSALAGRGFMLFPAAAFAVHQLRYELAYGSRSGAVLSSQGHGYLNSLAPWVVLLAAVALGTFLTRLARAAGGRVERRPRRAFAGLWAVASCCLFAAYAAQEWLEGAFAAGHPAGVSGVLGHGGWWAVVLSAIAGLVVALVLRLASELVEVVVRLRRVRPVSAEAFLRPATAFLFLPAPLARASAGRAPPGTRPAA